MGRKRIAIIFLVLLVALSACSSGQQGQGSTGADPIEEKLLPVLQESLNQIGEFKAIYVNRNNFESSRTVDKAEVIGILSVEEREDAYISHVAYENHSWRGEMTIKIPHFSEENPIRSDQIEILERPTAVPIVALDFDDPAIYSNFKDEKFRYKETPDSRITHAVVTPDTIEKIVLIEFTLEEDGTSSRNNGRFESYIVEIHLKDGLKIRGSVFFRYYGLEKLTGMEKWGQASTYDDFLAIKG